MNRFTIIVICSLLIIACPDKKATVVDCESGYLPCDDDKTECCEIICDDGYHICDDDSTECCLDTTSHNIAFSTIALGNQGSFLLDIAILSDDDIWVVGYIVLDSIYNAAHWDGVDWEYYQFNLPVKFTSIYAFDSENIWLSDGTHIFFYDGQELLEKYTCNWQEYGYEQVRDIYGISRTEIYFIGSNGSLHRYKDNSFSRMQTNTGIYLRTITSDFSGSNIFVTGYSSHDSYAGQSIILHIKGNSVSTLRHEDVFYPQAGSDDFGLIASSRCFDDICYFATYSGMKKYSITTANFEHWVTREEINIDNFHIVSTGGSNINNMSLISRWGHFIHYNGNDWNRTDELYELYPDGLIRVEQMDYKQNCIVAVGSIYSYSYGIIIFGYQ